MFKHGLIILFLIVNGCLYSSNVQLARIHEELNAGRQDTLAELRSDISELSEAIIQLAKSKQPKE